MAASAAVSVKRLTDVVWSTVVQYLAQRVYKIATIFWRDFAHEPLEPCACLYWHCAHVIGAPFEFRLLLFGHRTSTSDPPHFGHDGVIDAVENVFPHSRQITAMRVLLMMPSVART